MTHHQVSSYTIAYYPWGLFAEIFLKAGVPSVQVFLARYQLNHG